MLKRFNLNNKGQSLTEYMMILVLVAITALGVTQQLGKAVKVRLENAKKQIVEKIKPD